MSADGSHPDQKHLADMGDEVELEAVFDVKGIRFDRDTISFGLTKQCRVCTFKKRRQS